MRDITSKKILVTGAAGFIGSHLAAELKKRGGRVTSVDRKIGQDINKFVHSGGLKKNFDFVFHLAGSASVGESLKNPLRDLEQNLENTLVLLEGLRQLKKPPLLIFASSAAVYGIPKKMPVSENSPTFPVSPYGISKLGAEKYITLYSQLYRLPSIILRFFSVYGPGQRKQVIYDLIKKIQTDPNHLEILGSSTQMIDLIYIDDLVRAMILSAQKSLGLGEVYNLATGKSTKMRTILRLLFQIFKVRPKIKYLKDARPGTNLQWRVNILRLQKIDFQPRVGLSAGLNEVKKWFDENCDRDF